MTIALVVSLVTLILLGVRDFGLARERAALYEALKRLSASMEILRQELQRTSDDVYVLQTILAEHNLTDAVEFTRARARLVEAPRRVAQERDNLVRALKVAPTDLIIDEEPKLH